MRIDTRRQFHFVLAGLVGLVLLIGGVAIRQLGRLGSAIDVVMRENFRSVTAMQEFEESLERMDSAALLAVSGDMERARRLAGVHAELARRAVDVELGNITIPGERERAESLRAGYVEYRESLRDLMREDLVPEERRSLYFDRVNPEFDRLKSEADELIEVNQRKMVEANRAAHDRARNARLALLLLVFVTTWVAFYLALLALDLAVQPIRRLRAYLRGSEDAEDVLQTWEEDDDVSRLVEAIDDLRDGPADRDARSS